MGILRLVRRGRLGGPLKASGALSPRPSRDLSISNLEGAAMKFRSLHKNRSIIRGATLVES